MRIRFVVLAMFLSVCVQGYALDWKRLHEQADEVALSEAVALMESAPGSLENMYILALVYLNLHKVEEAEGIFEEMLVRDPDSKEAKWGLAEILRRRKETEASEEILEKLIKTYPSFSPAYITLAYSKYRQGEFNQAVKLALRVRRQERQNVDLSNYTRSYLIYAGAKGMIASRGGPLSKLLNGTQVLPNLKKAEALQPDSAAVLFGLGGFYFLAPAVAGGNIDKSLEYLQRAVEVDPLFTDAYVRLAQVYKVKEDIQKYNYYLDRAAAIDPDNELLRDEQSGICKFNCLTVEEE